MSERDADAPPPAQVSSTRLYLGNLPPNVTKADVEEHFNSHGAGEISEVKLMNGFGFIEYKDSMDARDVVPAFHGSEFKGQRLVVQFARGSKPREAYHQERPPPRTRRTVYRMTLSSLPGDTSWQDLKDFARQEGLDVVYSEVSRDRDGSGFVEYETEADLSTAVEKIDGLDFRGQSVRAVANIQAERPRDRYRSRSPQMRGGRGGYGPPSGGYHDEYYGRGPPRSYSPRGYRERSPPRRGYYDEPRERGYTRSPPRARGPADDYPPPRRYPDDGYGAPPPPRGYGPPPGYERDPYATRGPAYDRPPSRGQRPRSPGRSGGGSGYGGPPYERRDYW